MPLRALMPMHRARFQLLCDFLKRSRQRFGNLVGDFPHDASIAHLDGAMMIEQKDEWSLNRRNTQRKTCRP